MALRKSNPLPKIMGDETIYELFSPEELEFSLGKDWKKIAPKVQSMAEFVKLQDEHMAGGLEQVFKSKAQKKEADLVRLYTAAERDISKAITQGLLKGNNLDYLKTMQKNVGAILDDLDKGSKGWCDTAIAATYFQGAKSADIQTSLAGVKSITAGFGQVHQQAVAVLAENTYTKLQAVHQLIGRNTDDLYRKLSFLATRGVTVGYETVQQAAKNYLQEMADRGITAFTDVAGKKWNLSTYAETVARTVTMEAHLTGTANRLTENGHDLVRVSTHNKPCPKCRPWQGVTLSLSGNTQGHPTLAMARAAGLFHPRCRHAYGLALDLKSEIARLEKKLGPDKDTPLDDLVAKTLKTPEAQVLQHLRRAGVIPMAPDAVEIELLSRRIQVEVLPIPRSGIPDVSQLKYKGSGSYLGGAGEKHIYTDAAGAEYIFKPAVIKGGYKVEPFRAHVQEGASALGRMIYAADQVIEVKAVEIGGKIGTLQKIQPDVVGDLKKIHWKTLPAEDWKRIQEEHVLDWATGNFDAHGGNFVKLKDGRLLATDKEQAFRYMTDEKSWKMSHAYHPNAQYGEQEPLYNTMYRAFGKGEIDLDLNTVLPAIKRLEAIGDDEYKALFRPYAEALKGKGTDAEGLLLAMNERRKLTRDAYRTYFTTLLKQRDPKFKGAFKFIDEITETEAKAMPIAAQVLSKGELEKLSSKGLKTMAGDKGIKYANYMTKEELVAALADPDNTEAVVLSVGERIRGLKEARKVKKGAPLLQPPGGDRVDPFDDLEVASRNPLGSAVKKDAKMVENQQVTIRRVEIDGKLGYQVYFKVPKVFHTDVGGAMKAQGSGSGKIRFYRGHRNQETGTYMASSSSATEKGHAWVLKDGPVEMRFVTSEQLRAYTGYCEFYVYEADGKKAAAQLKGLLTKLKMDQITLDPAADDDYLRRLSALAWQNFPRDEATIDLKSRTVSGMEKFLKDRGVDPSVAKGLVEKEVWPGYNALVVEGAHKKYEQEGALYLWAGVGGDADRVAAMLAKDSPGLMSTSQRFQSGLWGSGGSEGADEASGGADSAFVRLAVKSQKGKRAFDSHYKGSGYRIAYDIKAMDRTDWYAYNSDSYGKTNEGFANRDPAGHVKHVNTYYSTGNEIMFRRGLSNEHVTAVYVSSTYGKDELLRAFARAGITEINGIKVGDLVKVRSKL